MKTAILTRTHTDDEGTFGTLAVWKFLFFTGELPWRNNKVGISCIPVGIYVCKWQFSPHLNRKAYHLQNVWGRSEIMIHSANTMGDTAKGYAAEVNGCIALGKIIGPFNGGQRGLLKSRDAVAAFESYLGGEDFTLEIKNAPTLVVI